MKKVYIIFATIVMVSIIFIGIMKADDIFGIKLPIPVAKHYMENEFIEQKDLMIDIINYFEKEGFNNVYITSTFEKGELSVNYNDNEMNKKIMISDKSIIENFTTLFEKYNYNLVIKDNNGIYFQRYSNLDYGRGVVYAIDGEPLQNERLTIVEPLEDKNWYFYEEK